MSKEACKDILTIGYGVVLFSILQVLVEPINSLPKRQCEVYHSSMAYPLNCTEKQ
jgi:hypothetical protein